MYAVIATGGKQYRVAEGDVLFVEKLAGEIDEQVVFSDVLTVVEDGSVKLGTPYLAGAKVTAKVLKTGQGQKNPGLQVQIQSQLSSSSGPSSTLHKSFD